MKKDAEEKFDIDIWTVLQKNFGFTNEPLELI
jgi:hypothetical protein